MNPASLRLLCIALAIWLTAAARAADPTPTVETTGHATLKSHPELMRLNVLLTADGDNLRDALAKLDKRRVSVKESLVKLGAAESAVNLGDPSVGNGPVTPQQRQMRMMIETSQRNHAAAPKGVTVSCTLTAEWPLTGASASDLLAASDDLQTKIKAALATSPTTKPKSPEEQEIAEEMANSPQQQDPTGAARPDEPSFTFVHKVTDAERAKLTADALANAKADAQRLADAAGKALGPIDHLAEPGVKASEDNPYAEYINTMLGQSADTPNPNEAIGTDASSVSYTINLTASYELK